MEETIRFKKFDKSDLQKFEKTLEKVWSYSEYTDNETIRKAFVKTDVHMSLFESNYKEAVFVNGEFAGVALARTSSFKSGFKNVKDYFKFVYYSLKLKLHSKESRKLLKNFKNMFKAYKSLRKQKSKHLRSELILFMVDPRFQRRGLGRQLIKRFEAALIHKKKKHYYLFTDSQCTYSFYNANGFHMEGETSIIEPLKDGKRELTIMLYSKALKGGV